MADDSDENARELKEYLAAVHKRNMLSKRLSDAKTPRIGIFCVYHRRLYSDAIPIRYGYYHDIKHSLLSIANGLVTFKRSHKELIALFKKWRKDRSRVRESDFLLGQVMYSRKNRKYVVSAHGDIVGNKKMNSEIMAEFCLPENRTQFQESARFK